MTEHSNAHHTLRTGASLTIELEGNPSTGYDWQTSGSDRASLARVRIEDQGAAKPASGGLVGAPVVRRWRITALHPGTARLIFSYRRAWESNDPVRIHTVIVDIAS